MFWQRRTGILSVAEIDHVWIVLHSYLFSLFKPLLVFVLPWDEISVCQQTVDFFVLIIFCVYTSSIFCHSACILDLSNDIWLVG